MYMIGAYFCVFNMFTPFHSHSCLNIAPKEFFFSRPIGIDFSELSGPAGAGDKKTETEAFLSSVSGCF